MTFYKIWLLFWKYLHFRLHYWKSSVFELIIPVLILLAFCYLSALTNILDKQILEIQLSAQNKHECDRINVLYTPDTVITRKLLKTVKQLTKNDLYTCIQKGTFVGVNSETNLRRGITEKKWIGMYTEKRIGIIFKNLNTTVTEKQNAASSIENEPIVDRIPDNLSYSILTDDQELTGDRFESYANEIRRIGYRPSRYSFPNPYDSIQKLIDEAYICLRTECNTSTTYSQVNFEPFPVSRLVSGTGSGRLMILRMTKYLLLVVMIFQSGPLIVAIISEKETGVKELMKVNGLSEAFLWITWFFNSFVFNIIVITVISWLLQRNYKVKYDFYPIGSVNITVLWTLLCLLMMANILASFMITTFFQKSTYAALAYIIITLFLAIIADSADSYVVRLLTALYPSGALVHGFKRIERHEISIYELNWKNIGDHEIMNGEFSVLYVFVLLLVQLFLYPFLTFYISSIHPGPFGIRKSPFFLFTLCWPKKNQKYTFDLNAQTDNPFIEKAPSSLQPDIVIENIHKKYGPVHAVNNANLIIYKNEITVLLGPNGAGKTTLMSILTGFTGASAGSIIYDGKIDVLKDNIKFRENVGFCPQENRLFNYLSTLNHLIFFARLKGASKNDAVREARDYIYYAELKGKQYKPVSSLSGGMKRKLCLGIALVGNAKVIILDEPTSGVDIQSRRTLWNLLLFMRKDRTVILTTHHLEEADALGDRIAIMTNGMVRTHGTSMFLKQTFDTGYRVTITKTNNPDTIQQLTNLFTSQIPGTKLEEVKSETEVSYILPLKATARYSNCFQVLENEQSRLGVQGIGVRYTSLEDVFLKVSQQFEKSTNRSTEVVSMAAFHTQPEEHLKGPVLIIIQLFYLIMKKIIYTYKTMDNLLFRVAIPTLILTGLFYVCREGKSNSDIEFNMKIYAGGLVMTTPENVPNEVQKEFVKDILNMKGTIIEVGDPIEQGISKYENQNYLSFKYDLIMAAQLKKDNWTGEIIGESYFSRYATHSLPVLLNTISNLRLTNLHLNDSSRITTRFEFLIPEDQKNISSSLSKMLAVILWAFSLGFFTIELCAFFNILLINESVEGFKHIQLLLRVSPITYWLSNLILDMILFAIIVAIRWKIFTALNFSDLFSYQSFTEDNDFGAWIRSIALFIPTSLIFTYLTSLRSKSAGAYYIKSFIFNLTGFIFLLPAVFIETYGNLFPDDSYMFIPTIIFYPLRYFSYIYTPFSYMTIVYKISFNWFIKNIDSNDFKCKCSYFDKTSRDNPSSITTNLYWLIGQLIVLPCLLIIIEMGLIGQLMMIVTRRIYADTLVDKHPQHEDPNVLRERNIVSANFDKTGSNRSYVLLVNTLRKIYFGKLLSLSLAVRNVTFSVQPSQCFGLLGVNGAGKSTTFKMLVSEILPTEGDASIMGKKLSIHHTQYLSQIGYCPQTNSFIEHMTGKQMLFFCAALKGVRRKGRKVLIKNWLSVLGLEEFENRRCGTYSGGNKRKLCTAMCLIGNPRVVYLDEPTTGVDVVSRRKLYAVMHETKLLGQSVILASHSMEECELLCDRLTIMAEGTMKCIGSSQELKLQYAKGFSVQIKIGPLPQQELKILENKIKDEMMKLFSQRVILSDIHEGLLYFQITDLTLKWSQLFGRMEDLKTKYSSIQDYVLSDTSLEEVFLSFSR